MHYSKINLLTRSKNSYTDRVELSKYFFLKNHTSKTKYSRRQKYESNQFFVKKLEMSLHPEFLSNRSGTFGPQICTL